MNKHTILRSSSDQVSFLLEKKSMIILPSLLLVSFILLILGLSVGSTMIYPWTIIEQILGTGDSDYTFIIETLRLPRMLLAFLVGAALAVSGLILQGIVRNPLASPDIIGITGGAKVAAVLFITYFSAVDIKWVPVVAILGAGIASFVIYILAWKKGVNPIRFVLIGIGIDAGMGALVIMMLVLGPYYSTSEAYIWLAGSIYGANWFDVFSMLPWLLIFIPIAILLSRRINLQELGDDLATGLGSRVELDRFILVSISVALAGSAVAFAGGIGFIGLIAPHIARKLVGRSFASLVSVAAIIGGLIVMSADVVARTVFLPLDLPAGVFVSGIGAPFFIFMLYQNRNV